MALVAASVFSGWSAAPRSRSLLDAPSRLRLPESKSGRPPSGASSAVFYERPLWRWCCDLTSSFVMLAIMLLRGYARSRPRLTLLRNVALAPRSPGPPWPERPSSPGELIQMVVFFLRPCDVGWALRFAVLMKPIPRFLETARRALVIAGRHGLGPDRFPKRAQKRPGLVMNHRSSPGPRNHALRALPTLLQRVAPAALDCKSLPAPWGRAVGLNPSWAYGAPELSNPSEWRSVRGWVPRPLHPSIELYGPRLE